MPAAKPIKTPVKAKVPVKAAAAPAAAAAPVKQARQQVSKQIGINLSVSRVRKHVDKNNVNADVEGAIAELKALVVKEAAGEKIDCSKATKPTIAMVKKAYATVYDARKQRYDAQKDRLTKSKDAADKKKLAALEAFPAKTNTLAEKIDYVSKLRCRFSNDASVVLSSGLDYVVQDLVRTAMTNARGMGKAIIQVGHVVQGDFSAVSVYPLVSRLPVVADAEAAKDAVLEEGEVAEEAKDDEDTGSTFEFYINLICKGVKAELVAKDETYSHIRISKHIRKFCSDVVIQLIERLSPLIKLYASTSKIKTVNDDVVRFLFQFLLTDAGIDSAPFLAFVDARLAAFKAVKAGN
jgi:hypothetical protein